MIRFATDNNIKLIFRSAQRPEGGYTVIGHNDAQRLPFVTFLSDISLLTLPGKDEASDADRISDILNQEAVLDVLTKPEEIQLILKNAGKILKPVPINVRRTDGLTLISVFNLSRSFAAELIGQADKLSEGEILMADYSGRGHYLRFLIGDEDSRNLIRYINERICNSFSD
jgi:aspartokinase